jgi:hypothetical protein
LLLYKYSRAGFKIEITNIEKSCMQKLNIQSFKTHILLNKMSFTDVFVSTQTFTVRSNIKYIDLQKFYDSVTPADHKCLHSIKQGLPKLKKNKINLKSVGFPPSVEGPTAEGEAFGGAAAAGGSRSTTVADGTSLATELPTDSLLGSVCFIKYQNQKKGTSSASVKKSRKLKEHGDPTKKNFLNCITMVIFAGKKINIKFFKNGVFQLTGCLYIKHVIVCLASIRQELLKARHVFVFENWQDNITSDEFSISTQAQAVAASRPPTGALPLSVPPKVAPPKGVGAPPSNDGNQWMSKFFTEKEPEKDLIFFIKSAMRNIDFSIGFEINRFLLLQRLISRFKYDDSVIIPDAVGNKTDIKIKLRLSQEEIENLPVTILTFPEEKLTTTTYKKNCEFIEHNKIKLENKFKDKFVSIFIFQNGKVLLSAADEILQNKYYTWFKTLIQDIKQEIKLQQTVKQSFYSSRK